jgi:hypothetical protein
MINFIKYNSNILSLFISIFSALFTIFLTFINYKAKFDFNYSFENSPNDRSIKVIFSITNLSNQAKRIDNVILYKGNKIVKDNGYSYSKVEKNIKNENSAKDKEIAKEEKRKKTEEANLFLYNKIYKSKGYSYEQSLKKINDFNKKAFKNISHFPSMDSTKNEIPPICDIIHSSFNDDYKYDSHNFNESKLLTKDRSASYSYWVRYDEIPDRVKVVSKNRMHWFNKYRYFKIK